MANENENQGPESTTLEGKTNLTTEPAPTAQAKQDMVGTAAAEIKSIVKSGYTTFRVAKSTKERLRKYALDWETDEQALIRMMDQMGVQK